MKNEYKPGKDLFIFFFLLTVCILRLITTNTEVFAIFSIISVLIAGLDIYIKIDIEFNNYRSRFYFVRGIFLIIGCISAVLIAFILIYNLPVPTIVSDELTTFALLLSLPKDLYCYVLGKFIKGE